MPRARLLLTALAAAALTGIAACLAATALHHALNRLPAAYRYPAEFHAKASAR